MAYGFSALVKTALASAVVTAGAISAAGLVFYDRLFPADPVSAGGMVPATAASEMARDMMQNAALRRDPAAAVIAASAQPSDFSSVDLAIPVEGVPVSALTDTFMDARSEGRPHDAIDIMAPRGTRVIAAAPGTVEKLFTSKAGGLTIYQRSADRRRIYYYAHLDSYAAGLHEGQELARGDLLGFVGFTGNASPAAPHLHFAIQQTEPQRRWYEPSTAINPFPLLARPD